MHMTIALNQPWPYLFSLQILLAMILMSSNWESVSANAVTPEIPTVSDNENEFMMDSYEDVHRWDKRAQQGQWEKLKTPWGKRAEANFNNEMMENEDELPLLAYKRAQQGKWDKLKQPWGKRAVANFNHEMMENEDELPVLAYFANPAINYENADMDDEDIFNEKRGWKKMNVAWGKRRNGSPYMNRGSGSWGKREPNWNNLKGMWGKRSPNKNWDRLRGSWGKRAAQLTETN